MRAIQSVFILTRSGAAGYEPTRPDEQLPADVNGLRTCAVEAGSCNDDVIRIICRILASSIASAV